MLNWWKARPRLSTNEQPSIKGWLCRYKHSRAPGHSCMPPLLGSPSNQACQLWITDQGSSHTNKFPGSSIVQTCSDIFPWFCVIKPCFSVLQLPIFPIVPALTLSQVVQDFYRHSVVHMSRIFHLLKWWASYNNMSARRMITHIVFPVLSPGLSAWDGEFSKPTRKWGLLGLIVKVCTEIYINLKISAVWIWC